MTIRALLISAMTLVGGCAVGAGAAGVPLPAGSLRPEDRVVLADFSEVRAIASSPDRVYVVYRSAVGIWLPLREHWDVPRSAPTAEALATVFGAVVDPLDRSLWLAASNALLHFDPLLDRWERWPLPGNLSAIGVDPGDPTGGVWVRSSDGWYHQPRIGSPIPGTPSGRLVLAPTVEDAYGDMPALRGIAMTLALGPGLEPGRLTAAAPSPSGTGWFVGTSRRGAWFVDRVGTRAEPLTLGLPGEIVGALASVPGGVWVTTDDDLNNRPASLSFLPDDLSATTTIEHDPAFGLSLDAVRAILPGDGVIWLGSNRGVVSVPIDTGRTRRWDESSGLADQRAISLAPWQQGVMVGTLRGVSFIGHDGEVTRPMPAMTRPVYALHAEHDTLWIGTDQGLIAHVTGSPEPVGFRAWTRLLNSRTPVYGIGAVNDTMVAMTGSDLFWRDPVSAEWVTGPLLGGSLGLLRAFHATPQGVWIGGDRGAAFVQPRGGVLETLRVGADLPDAVTSITSDEHYLWVGTMRGLVRFELRPR